jgi:PadR family transcriptional regulator PadR
MRGESLKGHLDLLILAAVGPESRHGYAVIETLRAKSSGVFDLPEGTIYPALHRLERSGQLASRWSMYEGRRRRIYRLTAAGKRALRHETEQWSLFSHAVAAIVGASA